MKDRIAHDPSGFRLDNRARNLPRFPDVDDIKLEAEFGSGWRRLPGEQQAQVSLDGFKKAATRFARGRSSRSTSSVLPMKAPGTSVATPVRFPPG